MSCTLRGRLGILALVVLPLVAGCRKAPPPPHVETLRLAGSLLGPAAEVGLDEAGAQSAARAALGEAGFVMGPGEPAYRARLELLLLSVGPSPRGPGQRVDVRVELELATAGEAARREQGAGSEAIGGEGPAAAARQALAAAVGEAARGLRVGLSAEGKSVEGLLADLDSSDPRARDHAAQVLGERREPRALPGLLRRLHDGDRRVVDRAIGALSQLKDPSAVPALIELSRGADGAVALRLVPVVGELGGPDAEGWLLTLQQAHPDARVREAAAEALRSLPRAREAARR